MTKLTKEVCNKMWTAIETELAALFEKYGVAGEVTKCRLDREGGFANFNLQVGAVQGDGSAMTPERAAFLHYAPMHGIDTSWLGRDFKLNGDVVRLTGYNAKAKAYPFICEIVGSNRFYKLNATMLERYMKQG